MINKKSISYRRRKRYYYPYPFYSYIIRCVSMFKKIDMVNKLPVLLYHSVSADTSPAFSDQFNVLPSTFDKQMKWLSDNGYKSIAPSDLSAIASGSLKCPEKSFILTFDDGYYNNSSIVLPILQKYKFKAFFFIATSFIGDGTAYPWIHSDRPVEPKEYGPMNADQLLELDNAGMFIGGHSHSHKRLIDLSGDDSQNDIIQSLNILNELLNKPVESFAYPYGSRNDFSKKHQDCCKDSGCKYVFTTRFSCIDLNNIDLFALPRLTVIERDGIRNFALKVQGYFKWFEKFRFAALFPFRLKDKIFRF